MSYYGGNGHGGPIDRNAKKSCDQGICLTIVAFFIFCVVMMVKDQETTDANRYTQAANRNAYNIANIDKQYDVMTYAQFERTNQTTACEGINGKAGGYSYNNKFNSPKEKERAFNFEASKKICRDDYLDYKQNTEARTLPSRSTFVQGGKHEEDAFGLWNQAGTVEPWQKAGVTTHGLLLCAGESGEADFGWHDNSPKDVRMCNANKGDRPKISSYSRRLTSAERNLSWMLPKNSSGESRKKL